ncbi:nuclear transport factor 2 family protein [Actinoplanes sp. NPDC051513]|uniref:nuclear transport factor 2 family protein n=1 Tax=Actinoplanes sp. NPDC051513 TaxID=3363908 RepID=UPI0037BC4B9C
MSTPLHAIQDHYAASAKGDLAGMLAPLSPDVRWTEMAGFPYAGTYVGPEAVRENVFDRITAEWADFQAVPEHFVSEGQEVVAFGTYAGTYRASGKAMAARFVHHWTVEGGVVVRFEQYVDTHLVASALS